MIPIGPYRPDVARSNRGVTANVLNVIYRKDETGVAYRPCPGLGVPPGAEALPAAPRGGAAVVTRAGVKKIFMGTAATIQEMDNTFQWTEVDNGYAVPAGYDWSMKQFGENLLATNDFDGLLALDLETPAGFSAVSGAPKFRTLFLAFDCLFGLVSDGDNRLFRNSAPNDYTEWLKDGAGYQPLPDGEELMNGGELSTDYAVVVQRKAVHLLTRTADRRIYTRKKMIDGVGAVTPGSFIAVRGVGYFMDTNGPQRVTPAGVEPIGQDRVARTFIEELVGSLDSVKAAYDPKYERIVWRHAAKAGDTDPITSKALTYDIAQKEFVPLEVTTSALLTTFVPGYTADNASGVGNVDTVPYGPDSRFWVGGEENLLGLDADYKAGFFDGDNLAATLDTGAEFDPTSSRVTGCVPLTDASTATVQLGVKQTLSESFTWGTAVAIDADGFAPVDEAGRVKSFRINVPAGADWNYVRGIDGIEGNARGPR
jgi:hypothetical protein